MAESFGQTGAPVLDPTCESAGVRSPRATHRNIYVRSRRAGERVMASVSRFLTKTLRLKVNEAKSAVARPEERKFLGFSISNDGSERRIAPKALDKFKTQIRDMTRRTRGISLSQLIEDLTPYLLGWRGYFGFCQTPRVLTNLGGSAEDYARIFGGSGKTGRIATTNCAVVAYPSSMRRSRPVHRPGSGACPDTRRFSKPCATAISTHSVSPASMSLPKLNPVEPPWYGPVCPVVWEGWHCEMSPYPDQRRRPGLQGSPRQGPEFRAKAAIPLRTGTPPSHKSHAPACGSKTPPSHSHKPECPAAFADDTTPTRNRDNCRSSREDRARRQPPRQTEPDVSREAIRRPREAARTPSRDRSYENCSSKIARRPARINARF